MVKKLFIWDYGSLKKWVSVGGEKELGKQMKKMRLGAVGSPFALHMLI